MTEPRRRAAASRERAVGALPALAVAVGLAVTAVVVQVVGGSGAGSVEPIVDEVRSAALPCPSPVLSGATAASSVTIAAPAPAPGSPAAGDAPAAGAAVIEELKPNAVPKAKLDQPGRRSVDAGSSGQLVARATNGLAPGLAAELISAGRTATARGLEAVPCEAANASAWFVGVSTAAGRRDRLVLTNPEAIPAVVDLAFWDEKGPVADPPNSTGIDVPAGGVESIPLDGMTAGHQRLGIAVTATSGRVSAAVHDIDEAGIQPQGVDWIAPAQSPTRTVVLPGLPDGKLGRSLQLLTPGDTDAVVTLRVLTPDNAFVPAGLDTIDLKAGQVSEFDLGKATQNAPSTLVVTSDRPVVAAVRLTRQVKAVADLAYATAAPALSTPAAIPAGVGPAGTTTRLMLAAPRGDAEVTVTLLGDNLGAAAAPRVVKIPANRTLLFDPAPKGGAPGPYSILLSPGAISGPVFAARVLSGGNAAGPAGLTVTAVVPGRYTVAIPGIEPDLTAVLP